MKFVVKEPFRENICNLMRKIGYFFLGENKVKGELILPGRQEVIQDFMFIYGIIHN